MQNTIVSTQILSPIYNFSLECTTWRHTFFVIFARLQAKCFTLIRIKNQFLISTMIVIANWVSFMQGCVCTATAMNTCSGKNIVLSPNCQCGDTEHTYHFFFTCPLFHAQRFHLLYHLSAFRPFSYSDRRKPLTKRTKQYSTTSSTSYT